LQRFQGGSKTIDAGVGDAGHCSHLLLVGVLSERDIVAASSIVASMPPLRGWPRS
jgi:hypothetical protein